jgi:hypothetical protein
MGAWEFEPLTIESTAVPGCLTVTFRIDWQ